MATSKSSQLVDVMIRELFALVLLLGLLACSPAEGPAVVSLTASDSLLARVLVDLHAADVDALLSTDGEVFSPNLAARDSVLHTYGIGRDSFERMIAVQTEDPERFVAIYNRALDIASGR